MMPTDDDVKKLHAEINQLVNQRFLVTTAAMTLYGAVTAWVIPKGEIVPGSSIGPLIFLTGAVLLILLAALFGLMQLQLHQIRLYSVYLQLSGRSVWEKHWADYRKHFPSYWGYTRAQSLVFLVLGLLTVSLPYFIGTMAGMSLEPAGGYALLFGVWLAYEVFIVATGFLRKFDRDDVIRARWEYVIALSSEAQRDEHHLV